jgi:hypothetical protein
MCYDGAEAFAPFAAHMTGYTHCQAYSASAAGAGRVPALRGRLFPVPANWLFVTASVNRVSASISLTGLTLVL